MACRYPVSPAPKVHVNAAAFPERVHKGISPVDAQLVSPTWVVLPWPLIMPVQFPGTLLGDKWRVVLQWQGFPQKTTQHL